MSSESTDRSDVVKSGDKVGGFSAATSIPPVSFYPEFLFKDCVSQDYSGNTDKCGKCLKPFLGIKQNSFVMIDCTNGLLTITAYYNPNVTYEWIDRVAFDYDCDFTKFPSSGDGVERIHKVFRISITPIEE